MPLRSKEAKRLRTKILDQLKNIRVQIEVAEHAMEQDPPGTGAADMITGIDFQPLRRNIDRLDELMARDEKLVSVLEDDDDE